MFSKYLFPFDDDGSKELDIDGRLIWQAQVNAVMKHLPLILLADIVVGTYLFVALFFSSGNSKTYIWYVAFVFVTVLLGVWVFHYFKNPKLMPTLESRWRFLICGGFFSGFVWGSIWLTLPAEASLIQMGMVVLWMCGISAGAAASLSTLKRLFFSFSLPPVSMTSIFLVWVWTDISLILLAAFLSYIAFVILLGLHIGKDLNRGIVSQLQNISLEAELVSDQKRLKEKEEEIVQQHFREQELLLEKESADRKLQAVAEERLLLLDSIEEGIYGINSIGKITFINSSALSLLGYRGDEVLGEKAQKLVRRRGGNIDVFIGSIQAIAQCYQEGNAMTGMHSEFVGKDGLILPVRFSCWPIIKKNKVIGAVICFSDISRQREMEALLNQSQKMEAIGRITGGVSHDFNNLLTVIMGNIQFLQRGAEKQSYDMELLEKMMIAAKSGAALINRLMGFSREKELKLGVENINEVLLETEGFLARILGENIELKLKLSEEVCFGLTDRVQLQNALLNICFNARDAMPNGGTLTISLQKVKSLWYLNAAKGRPKSEECIELKVEDTGVGMSDEVQSQVFEPFFTTKERDKGTGLGLSRVYGFMRQSGGNITVDSKVDQGTTFKLFIPLAKENSVRDTVKLFRSVEQAPVKYQGTVLVVEDDDNVRSIVAHMLVDAGFEVITARDAKSGLKQFIDHPEVDLVFSDIVMPGSMTGIEMAKRILKRNPNAPILLATGYAEKSLRGSIPKLDNIICVPKPYDTNELPKIVRSLIERAAS